MKKTISVLAIFALVCGCFCGCAIKPANGVEITLPTTTEPEAPSIYSSSDNWAIIDTALADKDYDVFFVAPSVYGGGDGDFVWKDFNDECREEFIGAVKMEKGIYGKNARFFAPFYHQAAISAINLPDEERAKYYDAAFEDVEEAFLFYMKHFNEGRPIVLAGSSQGADMCIRLLKSCFRAEKMTDQLIACYAIGWRITEEEIRENPQIRFASGEDDTGVLISFNSEAEEISDSYPVPKGTKSLCINPLNWRTDSKPAGEELNLGACTVNNDGEIEEEIPNFTGAYIDTTRGTLKVPDVSSDDYPGAPFEDGIFNVYDYQFFYRNLQENVQTRAAKFFEKENAVTTAGAVTEA